MWIHNLLPLCREKKSVFDFLTYLRETWFSFSYAKVAGVNRANVASDEIDGGSKFDNSLSFGTTNIFRVMIF